MPTRRSVIVGSRFLSGGIERVRELKKHDPITLKTEPSNPEDPNAVACYNEAGARLGYIPRVHNLELARLLAGGHILRARIDEPAEIAVNVDTNKLRVTDPPRLEIWW